MVYHTMIEGRMKKFINDLGHVKQIKFEQNMIILKREIRRIPSAKADVAYVNTFEDL